MMFSKPSRATSKVKRLFLLCDRFVRLVNSDAPKIDTIRLLAMNSKGRQGKIFKLA